MDLRTSSQKVAKHVAGIRSKVTKTIPVSMPPRLPVGDKERDIPLLTCKFQAENESLPTRFSIAHSGLKFPC
jgi:hypothetical protein